MQLDFYHQGGLPRVLSGPRYELLARFLEEDIQGVASANEFIDALRKISRGELTEWRRTGNAHTALLSSQSVTIESDFDPALPPLTLPHKDFHDAIEKWLKFIKG